MRSYIRHLEISPIVDEFFIDNEVLKDLRSDIKDGYYNDPMEALNTYIREYGLIAVELIDPETALNNKNFRDRAKYKELYKYEDILIDIKEINNQENGKNIIYMNDIFEAINDKLITRAPTMEEKLYYLDKNLTVDNLKDILKKNNMKSSGLKKDLIHQVVKYNLYKVPEIVTSVEKGFIEILVNDINDTYQSFCQELIAAADIDALKEEIIRECTNQYLTLSK